ncbi:TPA: ead/Ea22-like family protein [Escherichia coli]|nr:ead/Ea22-like family protein [Escherichia coli]
MTIDYQVLREAAEKATCGEWSLEYGKGRFDGDDALIHREVAGYIPICRIEGAHPESGFDEDFQTEQQANAEFIAAASPATVLALLDELEHYKSREERVTKLVMDNSTSWNALYKKLEDVEKRIAELEAEPVNQTYKLNELSGNSPVIPDGWISCSDLMPEDTKMLLAFSQGEIVAAYWNWVVNPIDYKKYRAFTYLSGNILDDVTHWMPLPEPPQEVK